MENEMTRPEPFQKLTRDRTGRILEMSSQPVTIESTITARCPNCDLLHTETINFGTFLASGYVWICSGCQTWLESWNGRVAILKF